MNRSILSVGRMEKSNTDEIAQMSGEEALLYVWELTQEIYSLTGDFDAQSRLQRDVVSLIRK